ncbi:unnamed protein product, partial [Allacma fusca]
STHDPEFDFPLPNLTAKQGTDVSFTCVVKHLGPHKVAWIKSDEKVILAYHTHMVAQNHRYIVTHNGHNTWTLHIKHIQQNDTGSYMCQVNTMPAKNLVGTLKVVVPADIIDDETSHDVIVKENHATELKCKASGYPPPKVRWRRQDGLAIPLSRELVNPGERIEVWEGELLPLRALQKSDTGAYYCIANNSIPPLVSKRVMVYVHFGPLIKVSNQLVAAPLGSNVTLECTVEALPKPITSWVTKEGQLILNQDGKYSVETEMLSDYSLKMRLFIANFTFGDVNDYNCSAGNSLGSAYASVKLINYTLPETPAPTVIEPHYDIRRGKHGGNTRHQQEHDGGGKNSRTHGGNRRKNSHEYSAPDHDKEQESITISPFNVNHNNENAYKQRNRKDGGHGQKETGLKPTPPRTTQPSYVSWGVPKNSAVSSLIGYGKTSSKICLPFLFIPIFSYGITRWLCLFGS